MPKNLLQDMVRVKISGKDGPFQDSFKEKKRSNGKSKYRIYFIAFISVIFLLFALSFLFSGAKITLVPEVKEISLNENLSAVKDSNIPGLSFDLVVISGEENKIIQGGEEEDIAVKAKGVVLIYNSYSSSSQVLDINTRLEGSNGKIYKTDKRITIPGMTKNDKPGSIEIGIHGEEAGEDYNSIPLDFKIFGFKGTSKYSKFYARSKGEIKGGFEGKSPVVSSLEKTTAVSELKAILKGKLLKKVTDQIPSGFILFKDAIFLDIDDKNVNFIPDEDKMVSVNVKGTLYGFLFDEKKLTKEMVQKIIDEYDGSEVYISNIRNLTFSFIDKESISFADVKKIGFTLKGTLKIIWKIDETKFVNDILSKKKKDFNQILSQYPNINSAVLIIRPFWKSYFPEKSKDIEIIVNYPQ